MGLCQDCGLCCDGTLFGVVHLDPDEREPARGRGLRVLQTDFEQPCSAFQGCACAIYEERPRACARFVCRLLERHRREGGPVEAAVRSVHRVRELLALLHGSGLSPEDFEGTVAPELARAHAELMRLLEDDFARYG